MTPSSKLPDTWQSKLKTGVMLTEFKGSLRQLHNHAMSMVPKGYYRWETAQLYQYDIERILQEMKMAIHFTENMPDDQFFKNGTMTQEDYIMYHQGYFLDLVHQLKDKMCHMIKAITTYDTDYTKEFEDSWGRKKILSKTIKDKVIQKIPGLTDVLTNWSEDQNGTIARALKKRTQYHHFKNPLGKSEDYVKAKTHRFMQNNENFQMQLSDYGKTMVAERGKQSFDAWKKETKEMMKIVFQEVEESIEEISKTLLNYFKFPTYTDEQGKLILSQYLALDDRLKPKNVNSLDKTDAICQQMTPKLVEILTAVLGDNAVGVYMVGSMARGEFILHLSDLNLVIIAKDLSPEFMQSIRDVIDLPAHRAGFGINTAILSPEEFEMEEHFKTRFSCRFDGILLLGKDITKEEKEHKLSFRMVYKLNSDFRKFMSETKTRLQDPALTFSNREITSMAREMAKRAFRLAFGQVVGNNTAYSSSYKEMKRLMDLYYPENKEITGRTYIMITRLIAIDREGLISVIESYERMFYPLLEAIEKSLGIKM